MAIFPAPPDALALHRDLTIDVEYRIRVERRLNQDFDDAARDTRSDILQRGRVGVRLTGKGRWSAYGQLQYAHAIVRTPAINRTDESSDMLQLYVQHTEGKRKLTIGRQKIALGSERLIGSLEWVNRSRSFDAVRFQNDKLDAFVGLIAVQNAQPRKARLAGITLQNRLGATSLIYKHDQVAAGNSALWTLGHFAKRTAGRVLFDGEAAWQFGRSAGKSVGAWALHVQATQNLSKSSRISLECNAASGGRGTSNRVTTFDNLYPTNHKFYGLMDMHAWKNMAQIAIQYSAKCNPMVDLKLRVAKNWLMDRRDAWYGASGAPNRFAGGAFVDPTGASGRDLGVEWNIEGNWQRSAKETLSAGFGVYQPGRFVQSFTGRSRAQLFMYIQYGIKL